MGSRSKIEWTDSTWPVVTGCTALSAGCDNCYAANHARRFAGTKAWPNGFDVTLWPERLDQPMRWRAPRKVFVCSTGDLFHDKVPDEYIAHVFAVMQSCATHTFQVLTKRHGRMRALLNSGAFWSAVTDFGEHVMAQRPSREQYWPNHGQRHGFLPNVWLGVSVESQHWADIRIPALLDTPAAVRYLSLEPLLERVELRRALRKWVPAQDHPAWDGQRLRVREVLHWVIAGGESGPRARPLHPEWVRVVRDDCVAAGIAFHFKQFGEYLPVAVTDDEDFAFGRAYDHPLGGRMSPSVRVKVGGAATMRGASTRLLEPGERTRNTVLLDRNTIAVRVGKRRAGRTLDGRIWDQYPQSVTETGLAAGTSQVEASTTFLEARS